MIVAVIKIFVGILKQKVITISTAFQYSKLPILYCVVLGLSTLPQSQSMSPSPPAVTISDIPINTLFTTIYVSPTIVYLTIYVSRGKQIATDTNAKTLPLHKTLESFVTWPPFILSIDDAKKVAK